MWESKGKGGRNRECLLSVYWPFSPLTTSGSRQRYPYFMGVRTQEKKNQEALTGSHSYVEAELAFNWGLPSRLPHPLRTVGPGVAGGDQR